MSSGTYDEGSCKECGEWTKSIHYRHDGLCLACFNKKKDMVK